MMGRGLRMQGSLEREVRAKTQAPETMAALFYLIEMSLTYVYGFKQETCTDWKRFQFNPRPRIRYTVSCNLICSDDNK